MRVHPITELVAHGIAGEGVFVEGREIRPRGEQSGMPDWWGDRLIYCASRGLVIVEHEESVVSPHQAAFVRASKHGWAAWSSDRGVWTSWGLELPKAVLLDMSASGWLLVGDNYQASRGLSAYRAGRVNPDGPDWRVEDARPELWFPYAQAAILDERAVWTEPGGAGRVLRAVGLPPIVLPWSVLHPTLCDLDGAAWVTYLRPDDSVVAHPWAFDGRGVIASGKGYGPVGAAHQGQIVVRCSRTAGEGAGDIVTERFDPASLRLLPPLSSNTPAPPTIPVPPAPPAIPPDIRPMKLHADVMAVVRAYAAAFPIPQGDVETIDQRCREWVVPLIQTVKARFPGGMPGEGGEFGHKRASETRPPSKEALALRRGAELHGWDLLVGVSTGAPRLADVPAWHDLVAEGNQVFIQVEARDHLAAPPSSVVRPKLVTPWRGVMGFDLAARFARGDRYWLDRALTGGVRLFRVAVMTKHREVPRTPEEGREQIRKLLPELVRLDAQIEAIVNVDTREFGLTEQEVREHTRLCSEIFAAHPTAIAGVQLVNQNSHGVEQPFLTHPRFLAELKALIDPRFPVSEGGWHDDVEIAGGSYITYHPDRSQSADANARTMAAIQQRTGKPVINDEPLGIAEPDKTAGRQRTSDAGYATQLVESAKAHGLAGVILHMDVGMHCTAAHDGPVQQDALRRFAGAWGVAPSVPVPVPPTQEGPVTVDQIAQVFAGAFFERVSTLLTLKGTVDARRPAVHGWVRERCGWIDRAYRDIFKRGPDLEGIGSRLLLLLDGWPEARLRQALQEAYDRGDR